jgi:peptidoglycan/xylan/chitin deacetylase (PgdA/CDA1 family)
MIIQLIKLILKEIISRSFFLLGGTYWLKYKFRKTPTFLILNYHNFSKYNNYKLKRGSILETGYADKFEKQIRFYKKHFNFCYPDEFFKAECVKGINVLITFDDGYKDNHDIALPILKKHHASAIFFITTNFIDSNNWLWHDKVRYLVVSGKLNENEAEHQLKRMNKGLPFNDSFKNKVERLFKEVPKRLMMNWVEVQKLLDNGFVVGAHTANHKLLTSLDENAQQKEMESSLNAIKQSLNVQPLHFAFPNGLYNQCTLEILENNKIKYAYTTKTGYNFTENHTKTRLKRIGINASDSIGVILLKLFLNKKK